MTGHHQPGSRHAPHLEVPPSERHLVHMIVNMETGRRAHGKGHGRLRFERRDSLGSLLAVTAGFLSRPAHFGCVILLANVLQIDPRRGQLHVERAQAVDDDVGDGEVAEPLVIG
jgi:hypothetical protein